MDLDGIGISWIKGIWIGRGVWCDIGRILIPPNSLRGIFRYTGKKKLID